MLGGDDQRWREIAANTTPFGAGPIFAWMYLDAAGATESDALEHLERRVRTDPPLERFARADSSRSHKDGSTGLGLAIVSAVVRAHHGSISVSSVPGRTEFRVRLPLV